MKKKLFTSGYLCLLMANFLLYFGFYLLMPVLPFYLIDRFGCNHSEVGIILSCYTAAALCIRPFCGYFLDTLARKPFYLFSFFLFTATFGGYLLASGLMLFTALRVVHGFSFGAVTVAGNTVVIDIMPSERRGEGLGYYGLMNNLAMSLGPMMGLFLLHTYSYTVIFWCAMLSGAVGLLAASRVYVPARPSVQHDPLSLDRFILIKGIPAGLDLLLLSIPYGMTTNYVALYAREMGLHIDTGYFFTFMALGLAVSRIFSGKWVDKGRITQVIAGGLYLACTCFFLLGLCGWIADSHLRVATSLLLVTALLLGVAFGTMFPAFNTLFVNLAPNSRRGTATGTYLTFWDVGIGLGMLAGGVIKEHSNFMTAYLFGAMLTLVSLFFFHHTVAPHFVRHKLR